MKRVILSTQTVSSYRDDVLASKQKEEAIAELLQDCFPDYNIKKPEQVAITVANAIRKVMVELGQCCTDETWVRIGKRVIALPKRVESEKPELRDLLREIMSLANTGGVDVDLDELQVLRRGLVDLGRTKAGVKLLKVANKAALSSVPRVIRDCLRFFREYTDR